MENVLNALNDKVFLKSLDMENVKTYYSRIEVLDKNNLPFTTIEGRISGGSLSIDGSSAVRRSGSLTFLLEQTEDEEYQKKIEEILTINKKIKLFTGIENHINKLYDDIIWFPLGVFVIINPSFSHSTNSIIVNLQLKDKMCLLNGDFGGGLPASVTFNEYDQIVGLDEGLFPEGSRTFPVNPNTYTVYKINNEYWMYGKEGWSKSNSYLSLVGERMSVPQRIFDIIQTLVCNYGGEPIENIIIEDVPLELKSIVRYTGQGSLYFDPVTSRYSTIAEEEQIKNHDIEIFDYNVDCGYVYTDWTYPGELISSIGDSVVSVLDKIKENLGNYEYFYDVYGRFIFREKKNYLNMQFDPITENGNILNNENYSVDYCSNTSAAYTFDEGSNLISSYTNSPNYTNIKNDYHIWGKNGDGFAIHYHIAIKEKPIIDPTQSFRVIAEKDKDERPTGKIKLALGNEEGAYDYVPSDWRAYLYMSGLEKQSRQLRPDIYEQELLDLFDSIYDFSVKIYYDPLSQQEIKIYPNEEDKINDNWILLRYGDWKTDIVNRPNDLRYWFDYLIPMNEIERYSVDAIGPKVHSHQQDKIKKLYNTDIPDVIMIDTNMDPLARAELINKCESTGQPYSNVNTGIYKNVSIGTYGYTAREVARDLLYQYTDYNASISLSSMPIYYLDVNTRIAVQDHSSGISGDYVIRSINLPLVPSGTMTISASRALTRI